MDGTSAFAIPVNTARAVVDQLEHAGRVVRAYIGMRGTSTPGGVEVTSVHPDGPADHAGIQVGDMIEAIDGRPAKSFAELMLDVDGHSPGDTMQLSVLRNEARGEVTVTLDQRPATMPAG
jgi:S1-C subfamily serine protease